MAMHDPLREALEIREQLASEKRKLAFFFGAGTSIAAGLPGIDTLTEQVSEKLLEPFKTQFAAIKAQLPDDANVEQALDRIRIYRELIGDSDEAEYEGIKGVDAGRELDAAICQAISDVVSVDPPNGLKSHLIFSQWLQTLHYNRDYPVEIFTINYDVLIEQAMESMGVPFFDGFVGSVSPFFIPEAVEAEIKSERVNESSYSYPPRAWTRLWKLHGSINWQLQKDVTGKKERIRRFSGAGSNTGTELMIFPSREKYAQSRKLPFISLQDRLRKLVLTGESLVIIEGYSLSDQHLNEILFQGLRSNPRLAMIAFMYLPLSDEIIQYGQEHRKLTVYGPDKACVGGVVAPWGEPKKKNERDDWPFWDEKSKNFTLGDFNCFAKFLEASIGFRQTATDSRVDGSTLRATTVVEKEVSES